MEKLERFSNKHPVLTVLLCLLAVGVFAAIVCILPFQVAVAIQILCLIVICSLAVIAMGMENEDKKHFKEQSYEDKEDE